MSKTPYILTDAGRFSDLMKQGFMRAVYDKPKRPPAKPKPIVSCRACENWHREGKHTLLDVAARRANLAKYRAMDKRSEAIRKGIKP